MLVFLCILFRYLGMNWLQKIKPQKAKSNFTRYIKISILRLISTNNYKIRQRRETMFYKSQICQNCQREPHKKSHKKKPVVHIKR